MSIYVDDGSGSAAEQTIDAVKLAIEGDGTSLHPGHLAPGITIRVLPPQTVLIDFSVVVYVYRSDLEEAVTEVKRVIAEYVNGLTIGKSVILSEVVSGLMKLPYVRDAVILSPLENITVGADQIPRYRNADVDIRETADE
jgi:uncharacterized phage protein gp47/JayE